MSPSSPTITTILFRTSDYAVASFLEALGFEHARLERSGRQVVFCFDNSPELVNAVSKYLSNSPIACKDFFRALRKTKAIIQDNIHDNEYHSNRQ